jgi:hypothetical protein
MRFDRILAAAAVVALSGTPAFAQRGGGNHGHGGASTAPHGNPHTAPATPAPAPKPHGNPHTAPAPTTGTSGTTTTTTTTTATTTATNPIATKIESHPQLAAKLTPLLPAGMTLATASDGFRNQGQFIAALHVSHNLNIPFVDLKSKMTGTSPLSLGQAIQTLRPGENTTTEVTRAEQEANEDLDTTATANTTKTKRRDGK